MEYLGTFGIQLKQKIQSLSNDPEHGGFVFFPQKKNVGPFVSFFSPFQTSGKKVLGSCSESNT